MVAACTILAPDRNTIEHYVAVRSEMLQGHTLPSSAEARAVLQFRVVVEDPIAGQPELRTEARPARNLRRLKRQTQ